MFMLTLETFLLLLLSGLLGVAAGWLVAGGRSASGLDWSDDRPWLRDGRAVPAAPVLPTPPSLLDQAERARLAEALAQAAETPGPALTVVHTAVAEPVPTAVVEVVEPPPPAIVEAPAPQPAAAKAPAKKRKATAEPAAEVQPAPEPTPAAVTQPAVEPAPAAGGYALPAEVAAAAVVRPVAAEDAARAADADAVGTRPLALAAPLGAKADDLKRIKGIGPQNEKRLNGLGIFHFSQIAAWSAENARWAGSFLAFPGRIEREDWIAQAEILATGADTAFSKRVDAGEVPTSQSKKKK